MITTNARVSRRLQIIVLAAGFSSRLGRSKALARVRGKSLLRRMVDLTAPLAASAVIIVAPPRSSRFRAELRGQRVILLGNRQRAKGLSSSIRRGLEAARYSAAALFLPVDLVHLRRRELRALIARASGSRRCLVARRLAGGGAGTPLILPRRLYSAARSIEGDRGLRTLVEGLSCEWLRLISVPSAAADVDTLEDLASARRDRRIRSI